MPEVDATRQLRSARSWLTLSIVFGVIAWWLAINWDDKPIPGKPLFKPSIDASFITEPLDENGDVDYRQVLIDSYGESLAPSENGYVLLVKLLGKTSDRSAAICEQLGIEDQPQRDLDWAGYEEWACKQKDVETVDQDAFFQQYRFDLFWVQERYLSNHPWTASEIPLAKQFLDATASEFQAIKNAFTSEKFYAPFGFSADGVPTTNPLFEGYMTFRDCVDIRFQYYMGLGELKQALEILKIERRCVKEFERYPFSVDYQLSLALRGQSHFKVQTDRRTSSSD